MLPTPTVSAGRSDLRLLRGDASSVMTATRSPLNSRGYAARRTYGQMDTVYGMHPDRVPQPSRLGDPFRVDVTPAAVSAGRSAVSAGRPDLRLLSGDRVAVWTPTATPSNRPDRPPREQASRSNKQDRGPRRDETRSNRQDRQQSRPATSSNNSDRARSKPAPPPNKPDRPPRLPAPPPNTPARPPRRPAPSSDKQT